MEHNDAHNITATWSLATQLVHSGRHPILAGDAGRPTIPPIYASTTYIHRNADALDQAFNGTTTAGEPAYVYARQGNPNATVLEEAMARAEQGVGAVAFGSGMAAIHAALMAAGLAPGTKIVASRDLYGPTVGLLQKVFSPMGVVVILADLCGPEVVELLRREQPDVIYVETLSNPLVKLVDIDTISSVAREIGAISIVDSTFTTPCLLQPITHGIDLVVHSATKYIGGHGDSTGGVVVSASNALLTQLRTYATLFGAMLSPFELHLMVRGLRTIALRMERHCENAMRVAHFLQQHPAVARVYYPGLPEHPQHALATRLFKHERYGGLLAFELRQQSREAVYRFMDHLQLCLPATTLGDVFTLVSYPSMSSHRTLTPAEREAMGIHEGCIRLAVGIEQVEDILGDLDQALQQTM